MSKAENRHDTKKWKIKRKDHFGDLCNNAKCGICAAHKRFPKTGKLFNKQERILQNSKKVDINKVYEERNLIEFDNLEDDFQLGGNYFE